MKVTLEITELARDRMVEALRAANLEVLARATEYQTGTCPHPDCPPGLCEDQPEPVNPVQEALRKVRMEIMHHVRTTSASKSFKSGMEFAAILVRRAEDAS